MPFEGNRGLAYIGLGVAALFAVGSVVAVNVVSQQRESQASNLGTSSSDLEQRYSVAAREIDAWSTQNQQALCELDGRIVTAVDLEQRLDVALDDAAAVAGAWLIINPAPREAFEAERVAAIETFAAEFTTAADAAVAEQYAGADDVVAACLAQPRESVPPLTGAPTQADVEALEARAAGLGEASDLDVTRLDALNSAVVGFAPAVLTAADARVNVNRLAATQDVLDVTAEALRATTGPAETLVTLEALAAHAQASLVTQGDIAAEETTEEPEPEPAPAPRPRPAPAPAPAPAPTSAPTTEPAPEPQPTEPANPGNGNGGDSPIDPLVP
ncbi:hypothetical protein [Agrococcus beijingensis]|uniref:hypothetical protein n=1 Tax=Agrococcus beijingensis TaxID=3068634 RepID=UPI00274097C5|nr:hypothetical protein [Agrococcus sp. REN33]